MFAALAVPNFRRYVSGQALVDRYSKRRVLLGAQAGLGLVSAALGVAVLTGDIRLWQVVVLAVLFGTLSAADNPARQAFVQEMVGHDLVRDAVTLNTTTLNTTTLNTTTVNVARVIGPTIAALLVGTVGIGWCFVVNAVSFGFVSGTCTTSSAPTAAYRPSTGLGLLACSPPPRRGPEPSRPDLSQTPGLVS